MNFNITTIFIKTSWFSIVANSKHISCKHSQKKVYYTFSLLHISCIYTLACDSLEIEFNIKFNLFSGDISL